MNDMRPGGGGRGGKERRRGAPLNEENGEFASHYSCMSNNSFMS